MNLPPCPRTCPAAGRSRPHPAQETGAPSRPSWAVLGRPRRTTRPHPAHGQASDPALARLRTARAHRGGGGGRGGAGTPASSIWVRLPRQAPRGLPDLGGRLGESLPLFCPKTVYAPRAVHFAIIPSKTRLFRVFSGTLPTLQNTPFPASQASYVGSIPIARSTSFAAEVDKLHDLLSRSLQTSTFPIQCLLKSTPVFRRPPAASCSRGTGRRTGHPPRGSCAGW